jgi:DNA-binding transcriptional LysR family regulator
MKPDIAELEAFVRVVDALSFTAAAEQIGLPKSRISSLISGLEAKLGTQLLYRTTRRVSLSHDGQVFYDRARDLLGDLDELEGLFQPEPTGLTGTLRVDAPIQLAARTIIPKLPQFLERNPGLEIELSSTDRFVDVVGEGFDCVLRVGNVSVSGLISRKIGVLPLINLASPAYLERYGLPQTLADLKGHYLVHYGHPIGSRAAGFEYPSGNGYETLAMNGRISVNNSLAFRAAAVAGLGIIQAPQVGMWPLTENGRLIEILPHLRAEPMPVSLLYPKRRHQARRVRAFIEWLSDCLSSVTV